MLGSSWSEAFQRGGQDGKEATHSGADHHCTASYAAPTTLLGELSAGASTSIGSGPVSASSSAGTFYYGACVDSVTGESDTTNNCSGSVPVVVSR